MKVSFFIFLTVLCVIPGSIIASKKGNDFQELSKKFLPYKENFFDIVALAPMLYYPVAGAAYIILPATYFAGAYVRSKIRHEEVEDKSIEKKSMITLFNETRDQLTYPIGKKMANLIEYVNRYITVDDQRLTLESNCTKLVNVIFTGITVWGLLKMTDNIARLDKIGLLSQKYIKTQDYYDAFRVLIVNKGLSKLMGMLSRYVIPSNAQIVYHYSLQ